MFGRSSECTLIINFYEKVEYLTRAAAAYGFYLSRRNITSIIYFKLYENRFYPHPPPRFLHARFFPQKINSREIPFFFPSILCVYAFNKNTEIDYIKWSRFFGDNFLLRQRKFSIRSRGKRTKFLGPLIIENSREPSA